MTDKTTHRETRNN